LIQVRTNLKGDTAKGYIRSLIEMGGLLKAIAAVEDDIVADANPTAEPAPADQTKQVNDPNATI